MAPSLAIAQTNFIEGYYITLGSDTVRGFVEYRHDDRLGTICVFKTTNDSKPVALRSDEIRGYGIGGKVDFESGGLENKRERYIPAFFKRIIHGRLSLYSYRNRFFVKKIGDKMDDITRSEKKVGNKVGVDYGGMELLKGHVADCPSFHEGFLLKEYKSSPDYAAIVRKYNQCFSESFTEMQSINLRPHVDVGILGGLNGTLLNFENTILLDEVKFKNYWSATGGVYFSIFIPRINENIRLVIEPSFGYYNHYAYQAANATTNDVFIKYTYIKSPIIFRHFFKSLFVDVGLNNFIILNREQTWRLETGPATNVVTTHPGPDYTIGGNLVGGTAGLGLRTSSRHPLYIYARYSMLPRFGKKGEEQPKLTSIDLTVALQLTKSVR